MTRMEPTAQAQPVNRDELKKVIRHELFFEIFRRKMLGCGGCLIAFLIVTGVPAILVASAAAKSGFFELPVLSRWLYEPSAPVRVVRPYVGTTVNDVLASVGRRAKYDLRTSLVTVPVTETEFTTLVSEAVASSPSLPFPVRSIQVAVEPRVMEVFALSPQQGRDATVLARITPTVSDGQLGFEVRELRFGAFEVPKSLAQLAGGLLTRLVTGVIGEELSEAGTIVNVETDIGEVRFIMTPNAPKAR